MNVRKLNRTKTSPKRKTAAAPRREATQAKDRLSSRAKRAPTQKHTKQHLTSTSRVTSKITSSKDPTHAQVAATPTAQSSKQSEVLAMLRAPGGTTIAAVVKATGWQPHSVRGFFAGIVRKKLQLDLTSDKVDGERRYRIGKSAGSR